MRISRLTQGTAGIAVNYIGISDKITVKEFAMFDSLKTAMTILCAVLAVSAQSGSPVAAVLPDSVLIVKGNSFFEDTVVSFVKQSLEHDQIGVAVKTIAQADSTVNGHFKAIVLLHAIAVDRLVNEYSVFMGQIPDSVRNTKVIVSTFTGDPWNNKPVHIDGVAGATKPYKPEQVGMRLLSQIKARIPQKK